MTTDQHTNPSRKVYWAEVEAQAREMDELRIPRSVIAEKLGLHRVTVQKYLGPKKKRAA